MSLFRPQTAYGHCDIPCGIYDPHAAQIAALSALRIIDLLGSVEDGHEVARLTAVKEKHCEECKHQVRIIWGDYFKQEHVDKYPEIHDLTHQIMQLASRVRQNKKRADAKELLNAVNRFAEIFWESKGVKTKRVKAPYKIEDEIVVPEL